MKEAQFQFTSPLTVNVVELKDGEHLFVEGDISTNDIDLVDDIMTKECQVSMQKQILEKSMKLDIEHEAFKGSTHEEKEINKTKIPAGKLIDAVVKNLGKERYSTRVKGEINRFNPNYKDIKGNLTEGYLDAFSVAFLPIDVKYEKKGNKSVRLLNDVRLLNVAMTGNPCNTKAQLTNIMTKSMDAVEEYKKLKELDPTIEGKLIVKNSHLTRKGQEITKFKNSNKMTENTEKPNESEVENDEGNESESVEAKAMKSMSENLKSLTEKYEAVEKNNVSLKESMTEMSKTLTKITEALSNPIHKSQGVQKQDAEKMANSMKSVDPLELCN